MQVKTLSPATWVISLLAVLQTSPIAHASPDCESRSGNSVVVNIGREDPIGGLAVRAAPSPQAPIKTVIPAAGTGVAIGSCHGDGWCEVTFECVRGWSLAARYLAPRDQRLYRVTNVSPNDPEGLNVRSGPGLAYSPKGNIPYNGDGIVLHDCQADGRWCLVTYGEISGWSARQLLAPMTVAVESAPAPKASSTDSVPFVYSDDQVLITVTVGGQGWPMLLDTGANVGQIPAKLADRLIATGHATEGGGFPVSIADGSTVNSRSVIIDAVTVGTHTVRNVEMGVGPHSLLGMNVLSRIGKFTINSANGQLVFS